LSWRGHFFKLEDKPSGRRNSSANKISFRPSNNRVEGDKLKFNAADQNATARTLWAFVDGILGFTLAATMSTERVEACGDDVDGFFVACVTVKETAPENPTADGEHAATVVRCPGDHFGYLKDWQPPDYSGVTLVQRFRRVRRRRRTFFDAIDALFIRPIQRHRRPTSPPPTELRKPLTIQFSSPAPCSSFFPPAIT
jgi:hypothetical protein